MMSVIYIFWMYVFLFGVIGAMRGWAKELMVIFSVITSLAVNLLLEKYVPLVRDLDKTTASVFWIRVLILIALVYFGYQTVNISRLAGKALRENLQDTLFGAVLGASTVIWWLARSCITTTWRTIPTQKPSAAPQTPPSPKPSNA